MEFNKCFYCMGPKSPEIEICPHCKKRNNEIPQPGYALPTGTILHGKYLIGAVIGQGGFGITYIGFDLLLNIKVAIKEYYPSYMVTRGRSGNVLWNSKGVPKEEGCNNFLKEARKMAKLMDIPEIVRVHDILQENDTAYIVMEFVEGITLVKILKRNGLMTARKTVSLLISVIEALDQVHKYGIIHRDISPDNIMIDRKGKARLLDLGAAKELDLRSNQDKQSSQMIHKDGFSPPEQYATGGNIGPWTDVYAMCATMYYCMTGKMIPTAMDRLYAETAQQGVKIEFPAGFDPFMRKLLEKGIALQTQNRFQTMGELAFALRNIPAQKSGKTDISSRNGIRRNPNDNMNQKSGIGTGQTNSGNIHKVPVKPLHTAGVGDLIIFGSYSQKHNTTVGRKAIRWQVLAKNNGGILVISHKGLACLPFNTRRTGATWENSTLREWLNHDFLAEAFSKEEVSRIIPATIVPDANPKYNAYPGKNSADRIFLLSYSEAVQYFHSDQERICTKIGFSTTASRTESRGLPAPNNINSCWWWLRTPGYNNTFAACVKTDGSIDLGGDYVGSMENCVRPVMWIKIV